ncbi:MAG: hypothetical protein L0216_01680 [Planctomycetales bacterium]|nr:hypothetical protein [Planctomycetales bacterium]
MGMFLRGVFLGNLGAKATALVLAVLVWLYVREELTADTYLVLPYEVALAPGTEWQVLRQEPSEVRVTFKGPSRTVEIVKEKAAREIRGRVVLRREELPAGDEAEVSWPVRVADAHFGIPYERIAITRKEPAEVRLTLGRVVTRSLRLQRPAAEGEPEPGFEIASVEVSKNKVLVRGLKKAVEALGAALPLEKVDVSGRRENFFHPVQPAPAVVEAGIEIVEAPPYVSVQLRPALETRKIEHVPVSVSWPAGFPPPPDRNLRIEKEIAVSLRGPTEAMARVESRNVVVHAAIEPVELVEGKVVSGIARLHYSLHPPGQFRGVEVVVDPARQDLSYDLEPKAPPPVAEK